MFSITDCRGTGSSPERPYYFCAGKLRIKYISFCCLLLHRCFRIIVIIIVTTIIIITITVIIIIIIIIITVIFVVVFKEWQTK